ncbi:hypothetical protein [Streptomyces sp. SID12501]|uniref:Uncharacterized protein n=1 Tax=Streptomyces sp. SID12501 TaxID=2706042 RepID=A0A6B3BPG9_9ACTN|nr:hypothetical protein [Streptomyces sp. SID12501]NEC86251.1 hypothetical protein [Streptomyces sp. SID12501]
MATDPLDGPSTTSDAAPSPDKPGQEADEQQRVADERGRTADVREATADEREATADRRETSADEREAAVDTWQDQLATQESRLDIRRRAAGAPAPSVRRRSYERIDRTQERLTAGQERLDRSAAALRRTDATDLREQEAIDRETDVSTTRMAARGPVPLDVLQATADRLREQAAAAAEALAEAEDALVDEHEQHHRAQQATEHRHQAAQARTAADTLRAINVTITITEPPEGEDGTPSEPQVP